MWDCEPGAREEAVLRVSLLTARPDIASRLTCSGTATLETKIDGRRHPGLGLLAATDTGLVYFKGEETLIDLPWPQISDLRVSRRFTSRRITVTSAAGATRFRDVSRELATDLQRSWLEHHQA